MMHASAAEPPCSGMLACVWRWLAHAAVRARSSRRGARTCATQLLQQLPTAELRRQAARSSSSSRDCTIPRVRAMLQALLEGNLYVRDSDKQVFIYATTRRRYSR